MIYSDAEIRESYRKAQDKDEQVRVLAELNAVPVEEMSIKLVELGLRSEPTVLKPPPFDEARALMLYGEGLCDLDIAERLGVKKDTFSLWRRSRGLPVHRQEGSGKNPGSRAKAKAMPAAGGAASAMQLEEPMTVHELVALLSILEADHPDAIVWMGNRMLQGVAFHAELDRNGKATHAVVELMDGGNIRAK